MGICVSDWREKIGKFINGKNSKSNTDFEHGNNSKKRTYIYAIVILTLLLVSGIERNPGPPTGPLCYKKTIHTGGLQKGYRYEEAIATHLIQECEYKKLEFMVCSNARDANPLDDVVAIINMESGPVMICLQSKHTQKDETKKIEINLKEIIRILLKSNKKKLFEIVGYTDIFTKFNEIIRTENKIPIFNITCKYHKLHMVHYSNMNLVSEDFEDAQENDEIHKLLHAGKKGTIYKLKQNSLDDTVMKEKAPNDFYNSFYIYTRQSNLNEMDLSNKGYYKGLCKNETNIDDLFTCYKEVITEHLHSVYVITKDVNYFIEAISRKKQNEFLETHYSYQIPLDCNYSIFSDDFIEESYQTFEAIKSSGEKVMVTSSTDDAMISKLFFSQLLRKADKLDYIVLNSELYDKHQDYITKSISLRGKGKYIIWDNVLDGATIPQKLLSLENISAFVVLNGHIDAKLIFEINKCGVINDDYMKLVRSHSDMFQNYGVQLFQFDDKDSQTQIEASMRVASELCRNGEIF